MHCIFEPMSKKSLFVISLDFELFWGMFDKVSLEQYGENIKGVHSAIPEILALFEHYGVHATWASVGMLMAQSKDELQTYLPDVVLRPAYSDMRASAYSHIENVALGEREDDDPYHFGAKLVEMIIKTPGQELGSHTFSHYYVQDGDKNSSASFAADCDAFARIVKKFNTPVTSLVFPRNQVTRTALHTITEHGFSAYRGNPPHFLYSAKKEGAQTNIILRFLRLVDAYLNISGHHTFTLQHAALANIPASRFLRPYSSRLFFLEPLRIARIKNSMTHAAKRGQAFHLWWHPHNFGVNRKENLYALTQILAHYASLKERYGMESVSMREAAALAVVDHPTSSILPSQPST